MRTKMLLKLRMSMKMVPKAKMKSEVRGARFKEHNGLELGMPSMHYRTSDGIRLDAYQPMTSRDLGQESWPNYQI
jgi:hypothetical protein